MDHLRTRAKAGVGVRVCVEHKLEKHKLAVTSSGLATLATIASMRERVGLNLSLEQKAESQLTAIPTQKRNFPPTFLLPAPLVATWEW